MAVISGTASNSGFNGQLNDRLNDRLNNRLNRRQALALAAGAVAAGPGSVLAQAGFATRGPCASSCPLRRAAPPT